ncbi:group III truncated hemoglobin [Botryobacter ruber]|uniref:group III truncated hemoglobin n=1 Tax=Botryobacter ruber TaxID=2171629 RepID=UPI000E0B30CF|nr:group III truncated hemoglobin [Botryobacter ruber]
MKKDIENEADIRLLVDTFYDKVNADDLLSPVFNDFAAVDWQHHLPVMYSFWSSILFGSTAYKGRPFPKHLRLPIEPQHFSRWIQLFEATVSELFSGEKAGEAKVKARSIAQLFQMKMGFINVISKSQ